MIDIHCHLLPGIDDGPATMAESLAMARMAVDDGITHIVVTPHIHPGRWNNTADHIHGLVLQLREALHENAVPLVIGMAAEVRLSDEIFKLLDCRHIPFYGSVDGYQLMLLEFPHSHIVPGSDRLVAWLMKNRIRPVIAHPERNKQIMRDPFSIEPFMDMGCLFQITAGSLVGRFGAGAQQTATTLLGLGIDAAIATDAHNTGARAPRLGEGKTALTALLGSERADAIALKAPAVWAAEQFSQRLSV